MNFWHVWTRRLPWVGGDTTTWHHREYRTEEEARQKASFFSRHGREVQVKEGSW